MNLNQIESLVEKIENGSINLKDVNRQKLGTDLYLKLCLNVVKKNCAELQNVEESCRTIDICFAAVIGAIYGSRPQSIDYISKYIPEQFRDKCQAFYNEVSKENVPLASRSNLENIANRESNFEGAQNKRKRIMSHFFNMSTATSKLISLRTLATEIRATTKRIVEYKRDGEAPPEFLVFKQKEYLKEADVVSTEISKILDALKISEIDFFNDTQIVGNDEYSRTHVSNRELALQQCGLISGETNNILKLYESCMAEINRSKSASSFAEISVDPRFSELIETMSEHVNSFKSNIDIVFGNSKESEDVRQFAKTATAFNLESIEAEYKQTLQSRIQQQWAEFSSPSKNIIIDETASPNNFTDVDGLFKPVNHEISHSTIYPEKKHPEETHPSDLYTDLHPNPIYSAQTKIPDFGESLKVDLTSHVPPVSQAQKDETTPLRKRFDIHNEEDFEKLLNLYAKANKLYYSTPGQKHSDEEIKRRRNINAQFKRILAEKAKTMPQNENGESFSTTIQHIENEFTFSSHELQEVADNKEASIKLFQIMAQGVYEKNGQRIKLTQKQRVALAATLEKVSSLILNKQKGKSNGEKEIEADLESLRTLE